MRLRIKFPCPSLNLNCVGTILFASIILRAAIVQLHPPFSAVPEQYKFRAGFASLIEAIKNGSYNTSSYDKAELLPPFHRYVERFEVATKYDLSMCHIQKIMSTILTGVFCYLNKPLMFEARKKQISKENWMEGLCRSDYHGFTIADVLGTRLKFVVVRNPIDRFLSGFLDKCMRSPPALCYGCRTIGCFIMKMHSRLWSEYKSSKPKHHIMEDHLAPLTWYCDFKDHLQSFIVIKYTSGRNGSLEVANVLDEIFKSAMVPKLLRDMIRREILNSKLYGMLQLAKYDILHSSPKGDEKSKKKYSEIKPCSIYYCSCIIMIMLSLIMISRSCANIFIMFLLLDF